MTTRETGSDCNSILAKIVSGGQTGVDRAALDAAMAIGLTVGGWCPRGRLSEDGPISDRYPLEETPEPVYRQRTEWNVRDSDGTLAICRGAPVGGTALTLELAARWQRPSLTVDLDRNPDVEGVFAWLLRQDISILNVAGPRESQSPGIYRDALRFLDGILRACSRRETEIGDNF